MKTSSPTIKFISLGCKVNQYDTQSIRERFLNKGYREIHGDLPADTYLINTCTVTAAADRKSRNMIRHCIRENPRAKVIVTGCLAQKDARALSGIGGIYAIISKKFFPQGISDFQGHTRAFLKAQDGCDNFCSYCKVPLVRGRSRSRPQQEIIDEAEALAAGGFQEIVLSGICLGAYGRDLPGKIRLVDLISHLENVSGLRRIRLSSIEAADVSDKLVHKISDSPKLCRHLHIPLQSGDDKVLKAMRRHYSRRSFLELIAKIRKRLPDISITSDVMLGFPGEQDKNFQNTVKAVKEILPLKVHIFPFSPRQSTAAFVLEAKIRQEIIQERLMRLRAIAKECSVHFRRKFIGREMEVLFEEECVFGPRSWVGLTGNYIKVTVPAKECLKNKLNYVEIKEIRGELTAARLVPATAHLPRKRFP